MKRREFMTLLGGAVATWPIAARAQQSAMPVVGLLSASSPGPQRDRLIAFHRSLKDGGYVEGQNVAMEYRWADGQYDKLPSFALDLVARQVNVIVAGGPPPALAAKAATTTIPIVFISGVDPVKLGLVASFNRPGGNLTGIGILSAEMAAKRLGLLHELIPQALSVAVLVNPNNAETETVVKDAREAASRLGLQLHILEAGTERDYETAFAVLVEGRVAAVLVGNDPFFNARREQLVALAARHAVPAIYEQDTFAAAGGLISYGPSLADAYRQAGIYVGRILKGERPAELPVVQPTRFELVINLKTAKTLGLDVPDKLIALADEVIE
jgi:ABC-type uncharacterized transport system substrate-binding protein